MKKNHCAAAMQQPVMHMHCIKYWVVPLFILANCCFAFNVNGTNTFIKNHFKSGTNFKPLQTIPVTGKVTDEANQPLSGVSVIEKGTANGTVTQLDGSFKLDVKSDEAVLIISSIGFTSKEIPVKTERTFNITLAPVSTNLNDVIVTGYSKQSKRDVTGAASTISAEKISQTPVTDISSALQGRVAGLSVDNQGGPGNNATVRIRGIGTLGNNDPLYVIDGVQMRMGSATGSLNVADLLNGGDIESVTILKDPSLCALYGAEGSNGVIVITTKSGKRGDPRFEYNTYIGEETPRKFPKMVTPQEQANAFYQSYINSDQTFPYQNIYGSGTSPVLPDYLIGGSGAGGYASGSPQVDPSLYSLNSYRIMQANKTGTDWWKALFQPALSQNHQISISGATDKNNYALSLGYMNSKGTLLNTYFKRLSVRFNSEFKLKPWLKIGENIGLSYTTGNSGPSRAFNNPIASIWSMSPLMPTHDIAGNISGTGGGLNILGGSDPLAAQNAAKTSFNHTEGIIGSAYVDFEPIKNLVYESKIGFQLIPNQYHYFNDTLPQEAIPSHTQFYGEGNSITTDWRWTNKLSYSYTLNNLHKFSAFLGYEAGSTDSRYSSIVSTNLIGNTPNYYYVNAGTFDPNFPPGGSGDIIHHISQFGNLAYSYNDKYYFSGTLRHDGSSVFGTYNQYGWFPAFSAGWRLSEEGFLKNALWLSDLKLRGSWGRTGNDAISSTAQFTLAKGNDLIYGGYDLTGSNISQILGLYPSQLGNGMLQWEVNQTTNLGFDAAFFHNRLTMSANWFDRKTDKLLYTPPYSGTAGSALPPIQNIMNFTNKGLELEIGFNGGNKNGLSYDMSFNISGYKSNINYISAVADSIPSGIYAPTHFPLGISQVGHPVGEFWGYQQTGIWQSNQQFEDANIDYSATGLTKDNAAGHFMYADLNHDGKIDNLDQTFLGNPAPKFSYGYNINLYYKQFDFGLFLQGVYGNKIFNYWRAYSEFPGMLGAGSLNTWSPTNTNAPLPIYTQDGLNSSNDVLPSSFFVESGSYLRVKLLQLGYTFPKLRGISKLRIYVQGYNLLTFTKYSGMDPEVSSGDPGALGIDFGTQYPISRKILFGLNLSF